MTNVAIIRCEKNEKSCPLTSCLRCLENAEQGFASYENPRLVGVFTCRCPGDEVSALAKILHKKGAEAIHLCTCLYAKKTADGWMQQNGGFCDKVETLCRTIQEATGLPCVKGTAHLPKD